MDYTENTLDTLPQIDAENAKELADAIAEVLDSKKGRDIKVLHVEDKTVIAEYFVICTGNSSTQIKALAGEVEYQMGFCGIKPYGMEGYAEASWILIDYTSVIVHIFNRDTRDFYKLEKLWSEAEEVDISSLLPEDIQ